VSFSSPPHSVNFQFIAEELYIKMLFDANAKRLPKRPELPEISGAPKEPLGFGVKMTR
jgi:hypothetical protein